MGFLKVTGLFDKNLMPEKEDHCVYSLLDCDKNIIYVGQSSNLKARIFSHLSSDKDFDYVEWALCDKDDMNNLEALGIVKANGSMNKVLPKNDLYMSVGRTQKEIAKKVADCLSSFIVFSSHSNSKYITRENYNAAINLTDEISIKLKAECK
tara:strand:- start:115 stop:570 length:456 start_codon:yes stop_codon:yes gene_type:complete